jgi:hypothetical protein
VWFKPNVKDPLVVANGLALKHRFIIAGEVQSSAFFVMHLTPVMVAALRCEPTVEHVSHDRIYVAT